MTRVLIVDDKPENLYLLHALLQGHGLQVEEARHGAEALVKARQNPPRLVISDLLMPVMDGYSLLRQWKSDGGLKQIPFIVYTATYTDPKDEKLALDLGADAFLVKPAEPEPFMALIRDVLAKSKSGTFADPRHPHGEEKVLLKEYNEALIRKLEAKSLELEQANRTLQAAHDDLERRVRERTAALRESEGALDMIFNSLRTFVALLSPEGELLRVNETALRATGSQPAEVLGRFFWDIPAWNFSEESTLRLRGDLARVAAGETAAGEYRIRLGPDRFILMQGFFQPIRDAEGRVFRILGEGVDITERRLAEDALARSEEERARLEEAARLRTRFQGMVGKCAAMQEVYRRLRLGAQSEVTVLLTGESGTGKELAASALHELSARKSGPFVGVNCSAIPETLLESELFGHVKGAFTGAVRDKIGLFQAADGGTLFLDEVGDMAPQVQVKVLRVLETRELRRVGGEVPIKVDVRLVTATNQELQNLVASGKIREDFYYRIRVFDIRMPPLRERREDIPLLVEQFIHEFAKSRARPVEGVGGDALRALMAHSWPGNVRELRNAIEHAFVTVEGSTLRLIDLPPELTVAGTAVAGETRTDNAIERERIVAAFQKTGGNRSKAAKLLGCSRVTLWKKIRALGIDPNSLGQ